MTPETKFKISQSLKRYASTPEGRFKLRIARLGKRHTLSTIARIRKSSRKSHKLSPTGRTVLSNRMKAVHSIYKKYGASVYFSYMRTHRMLNTGLAPRPNVNPEFDKNYEIYLRIQKEFNL